ncbi:hypothetical protein BPC006_II2615 [Burkholderia pseudomallei BPC006]|nr:hypothetical protein BPC006_II2615 [Burkholderia pseudomallei BPC006]
MDAARTVSAPDADASIVSDCAMPRFVWRFPVS